MKGAIESRKLLYFVALVIVTKAAAQQATVTTLGVVAGSNPPTVSAPITLMAAVSPPTATGKVTFYDGTTILGVANIDAGRASFTTTMLASGDRSLKARYWGDIAFNSSVSGAVRQSVRAKEGFGYSPAPGNPFPAVSFPLFAAVADFNGDGKPDLAVLGVGGITILLNKGDGGFALSGGSPFANAISAVAVAVGDFNGDGKPDLAIPDLNENNVSIWLGDGAGGFVANGEPFATGRDPVSITVADFNGDGTPDVAVLNADDESVTVLLGDGSGGLQTPGRTFAVGSKPSGLVSADFNGDGNADLAAANKGDNSITVLLGDGRGAFIPTGQSISTVAQPDDIFRVEDLDGDGNQDLAVAHYSDNSITLLLGDGNGGFTTARDSPFAVGTGPVSVAVGDFNGDGKPDLVVGNWESNDLTFLLGKWSGDSPSRFLGFTLSASSPVPVGTNPFAVIAADFDGDGRLDVATANFWDDDVSLVLADLGLTIAQTQQAGFVLHQAGAYFVTVSNQRENTITGEVKVSDVLPPGLTLTEWAGAGWNCASAGQTVTCTRSDPLVSGQAYAPIKFTVQIAPAACPIAPNRIQVSLNNETSQTDLANMIVSNCLTIKQVHQGKFIVGQTDTGTYTLTVERASGAVIPFNTISVIETFPAGITPTRWSGDGWKCNVDGTGVICQLADYGGGSDYPPITLTVSVSREACSYSTSLALVDLGNAIQAFTADTVDLSGCLSTPSSVDFQMTSLHAADQLKNVIVESQNETRLSLTATIVEASSQLFSIIGSNKCNLNPGPGDFCVFTVSFSPSCLGQQAGKLIIQTDAGSVYEIPLSGTGVANHVSFDTPANIAPGEQYQIGLKLEPELDAACSQTATISPSFSPIAPDKSYFDVKLDRDPSNPNLSILQVGTVAGAITLEAQVNGKPITAVDQSGSVTLAMPARTGVVRSVSIDSRTQSSFEVNVAGFSTPREIGDAATTEVCLSFWPAAGATLAANSSLCALKEDIRIWYERFASFPTGSQFKGSITVSFSGGTDAIGGMKAVIKNRIGDSEPYCVDFRTGNRVEKCP